MARISATADGCATQGMANYYARFASGGFGLVITEGVYLCADIDGFSLHAAVRCGADDRQALEQLCRYITRPLSASKR